MGLFDWIHSKLDPKGFADKQQEFEGLVTLRKAGYQLGYQEFACCEFCSRRLVPLLLQEVKTNPRGHRFTVERRKVRAEVCAYCGYIDVFDTETLTTAINSKQGLSFVSLVEKYPPIKG